MPRAGSGGFGEEWPGVPPRSRATSLRRSAVSRRGLTGAMASSFPVAARQVGASFDLQSGWPVGVWGSVASNPKAGAMLICAASSPD
jgi:hypothetical protein